MRSLTIFFLFGLFYAIMLSASCVFAQDNLIANALAKSTNGDFDDALADFNKAVELAPTNSVVYYNRGLIKRKMCDLNGAIADYSEAIKLNTNYTDAYRSRGGAETILNDLDGALADFTVALQLEPYDELTRNLLNSVRSQIELKQAQLAEPVPVKSPPLYTDEIINITNTAGTVYHDVRIVGNVPDGIYFEYANTNNAGGGKILFVNLSDEWKTRFKYSPEAADQYRENVAEEKEQCRQARIGAAQPYFPPVTVVDPNWNTFVGILNEYKIHGPIADYAQNLFNQGTAKMLQGDKEGGFNDWVRANAIGERNAREWGAGLNAVTNHLP
jgi:tetratricopeptide (TPR) repeat protein